MKDTNKKTLNESELFKEIVKKISSVLDMIATERDFDIRSLVLQTDMSLENIGYPYYETFNVISSVKRILNDSKTLDKDYLPVNIFYREMDNMIHTNLKLTTEQIWFEFNYTECLMNYLDQKNIYKKLDGEKATENLFARINFSKISTDFLDSVFPTVEDISVFVEAHKYGFRNSRKCIGKEILLDIREGSEEFCQDNMLRYLKQYSIKQSNPTKVKLKKYMNTQFSCDKTAAKVIVMLFHYLSEVKGKNTRYEIILKDDNKYRIK